MSNFLWVVAFTGHRNKMTNNASLLDIYQSIPNAKWIHGNAKDGFDAQVKNFIKYYDIPFEEFDPEYEKYPDRPKYAPLARNFHMVDICNLLVACYDGRRFGGTYQTIEYAKKIGRPVRPVRAYGAHKGKLKII